MSTKHINITSFNSIPVFPLNNVHLFPGCILPLHIYEPRYIDLLKYANEHDEIIAIADPNCVTDPSFAQEYCRQTPYIPSLVGCGVIIGVKKTQFDTYHVMLQGLNRLKVLEELPMEHRFRQLSTQWCNDDPVDIEDLTQIDFQLRQLIQQYGQWMPSLEETIQSIQQSPVNPETFVHLIAAHILESKAIKRHLFMETNPLERSRMIESEIGRLIMSSLDEQRLLEH